MSGIFGIYSQNGPPVAAEDLRAMGSLLVRRGPEGTGTWHEGGVGLGHTLLATTPELLSERQPLKDMGSGCVITADVRLDNRAELLAALGLSYREYDIGDAGLILAAYLARDTACVERFLGDFAFAIWDPRQRTLFCARDHLGMRPFYYHHSPGRFFVFASEPRSILVLPQVPYRINEGRIADFLVPELEGIDKTCTFFEQVYRLPPAHTLTVTPESMRCRRYWVPEPGPELRLSSNEAYGEAFLDVFTEAVGSRLRGAGPVGSMLSGGMDSGSVVAVARDLLAKEGRGPLPTFSGVGPNADTCVETRTIKAALTMDGLAPCILSYDQLEELMPKLEELTWNLDEPFDGHMTLLRVVYLSAHRRGLKVLLDGGGGDTVLSEGRHLARLLRRGRWIRAFREAVGQNHFWCGQYPAWRELIRSARTAFVPSVARRLDRRLLGPWRERRRLERALRESIIGSHFANRVGLSARLRTLSRDDLGGRLPESGQDGALALDHPYLTAGRERYDRVASAVAMEPRDPFLDRRVLAFCLSLPAEQKMDGGWPKVILRRAMVNRLPDAVRWRCGKEHLGWAFTMALMKNIGVDNGGALEIIEKYVNIDRLRQIKVAYCASGNLTDAENLFEAIHLAVWLGRQESRPKEPRRQETF